MKWKNYEGFHFSYSKNMANFEAFRKVISSSINLLFLKVKRELVFSMKWTHHIFKACFLPTAFKAMFRISKSIRPTQGLTNSSKMVNKVEFNEVMSGLCKSWTNIAKHLWIICGSSSPFWVWDEPNKKV